MFAKKLLLVHLSLLAALLSTAACSGQKAEPAASGSPSAAAGATPQTAAYETVAEQLRAPWAIDFAGDIIYISERAGSIVTVEDNRMVRHSVRLAKPVYARGEGGFLGLALAPDFKQTRRAYAYHTYQEKGETFNRIVVLQETTEGWNEIEAYLERIPGSGNHNGGRLAIGPDRSLYITTGDAGRQELAQNLDTTAGKILRMSLDGKIPADNPFPGSYVYSYGHRNSQGIAWDKQGRMYASEHGPSGSPGGHDEINRIEAGGNYGWPEIIGDEAGKGMKKPLYHTGDTAIAPSGIAMDPENRILIAALRGEKLFRYEPASGSMLTLLDNEGRVRDVKLHNGKMYVITNNTDGRGRPGKTDDRLLMLK